MVAFFLDLQIEKKSNHGFARLILPIDLLCWWFLNGRKWHAISRKGLPDFSHLGPFRLEHSFSKLMVLTDFSLDQFQSRLDLRASSFELRAPSCELVASGFELKKNRASGTELRVSSFAPRKYRCCFGLRCGSHPPVGTKLESILLSTRRVSTSTFLPFVRITVLHKLPWIIFGKRASSLPYPLWCI